jgi:hypothetical protein
VGYAVADRRCREQRPWTLGDQRSNVKALAPLACEGSRCLVPFTSFSEYETPPEVDKVPVYVTQPAFVRTNDSRICMIGYTCELPED